MKFTFITLFPDTIRAWLDCSIIGRAKAANLFEYETLQLRDFARGKHAPVDDVAYGGGGGMVLKVEPLAEAVDMVKAQSSLPVTVICFSPGGARLNQRLLDGMRSPDRRHYVLVCGHYEGIDQRFIDNWVDLEISIGDFVVSGGELPALLFADSMIRGLEGSLGHPDGYRTESFQLVDPKDGSTLIEYPHFTRPAEFRGHKVPAVLTSGDHGAVEKWRLEQSRLRTKARGTKPIFDNAPSASDTRPNGSV